ncbi:Glucose 1-dehydrogenase [Bordetella tumbae]|uniref:SDR family NAD(P)-dependent oxidoreductase n=1 Tax=Bordetella tumbae TaxID=1649139 RepID=UPI0039F0C1A2
MRLKNKIAIITGAANGMGEAEARLFAQEGATVVLSDIDDVRGELVAGQIRLDGGQATFFKADVSRTDDWKALLDHAVSTHSRLDILINNAGISSSSFGIDDLDAWDTLMDVNSKSVYIGSQLAAEIMKKAGRGSIVNISSIFGIVGGETGHPAYHASKAAVRNVSKALAVRLASHGVRVNSVHPGYMTPMVSSNAAGVDRASKSPMMRLGQPIEVAYGVLFLASDEASFVTGAELAIDGGFLAR